MMLTPGDLPFFLKIALEVCAAQNPKHLVETLVITDHKLTDNFTVRFNEWSKDYNASPLRLVTPNALEKLFIRYHNNAHNNCWLQMVRGINAVRTIHALWHDVDLFISDPNFLTQHYEACQSQNLGCLGVSKAWDGWFEENGIDYLVGTWELMLNTNWVRRFAPWEHRGHDEVVLGQPHTFDISFWPQYLTGPDLVKRHEQEWGFIHFNYVTGTYRRFQQAVGPFEDDAFKLLLVRLLIDAYDPEGDYEVPRISGLMRGITDPTSQVTYCEKATWKYYPEFRKKLQTLIDSDVMGAERSKIVAAGIHQFEQVLAVAA